MEFSILGPLEVRADGQVVPLGGAKPRALLAALLLHRNEPVSAERLALALWGEEAPAGAVKTVQVHVSRLRKALGDPEVLTTTPAGYRLRVLDGELDAERFERLVAEAAGRDHEAAAQTLREALAMWRGPALADLVLEPLAQTEIARLEELRFAALEQRFDAELAAGRHAEVAGELEALVRRQPLRERFQRQLMLCLYRGGRQGEALEAYRAARAALVEELGIEPGRELRELHAAILRQDPALDLVPEREPEPEPARAPARGAFVGRARELGELVAGLDEAVRGHGRLFVIAGQPGIGKSRLSEELTARAAARGARVLVGRCWEAGGAPAYWPWVHALRSCVRDTDDAELRTQLGAGAAHLAPIVPELRQRFPDLGEPPALEPDAARFRLFEATVDFLERASRARPMVLVLDDLHAADAASLLLLRFVARALGSMRILLLAAHRDVDPVPGPGLVQALTEIAREPVARRLALGGLSEGEVGEYLELTAAGIASPEVVAALHDDTEGNPLFVGEYVRLLSVEGAAEPGRLAIPQTVRDVIARRLAHLSPECGRVVVLASVFGREFAPDALASVSEVSEDELLDTLDEAMAARLVSDVPGAPDRLRFAHVLIRDTLYEGLTSARRLRVHRRVVDVLERRHGDEPGAHLAELAHHAIAAHDAPRALRYARAAGDRALAHLAYEEAARIYRSALIVDAGDDERTRCELLIAIAEAESQAGDMVAARTALREAAGIARRLGLTRELARAAAEYGGRIVYARAGEDDWILPLLEEALAAVPDGDLELRSGLLARLAGALRDEPSRVRRDALSAEAVELARRSGDDVALAYALDGRAIAILAPDTIADVLAVAGELLEVAERTGDRERVVHGHMHALGPLLMTGDLQRAEAALLRATQVADELRQPAHLWDVAGAHAMLAVAVGRLGEAERLVDDALAVGERVQPEMVLPVHRMQRFTLCDFRGALGEIEPGIRELVAAHPSRPVFRCALAQIDARLGRLPEAGRALSAMTAEGCAALPFDQEWLLGMSLLAETAHLVEDTRAAAVLYEKLLPWAGLNVVDQCEAMRGSVARYLGLVATTAGRLDEAPEHFEAALAMNERMAARPWLALTQRDYARMLRERGARGDRERAQSLAGAALATCRNLGWPSASSARAPR